MTSKRNTKTMLIMSITVLIFIACASVGSVATESALTEAPQAVISADTLTPESTSIPTPQSLATPSSFGPDQKDFPKGYNPLSGEPVEDPQLLQIPALLISISHFPAIARPQAGLSFAPWVFEFYITEGATRFLSVFHGAYPQPEIPISGNCEVRKGVFTQTREAQILGNQVWLDKNKNGRQESYEPGVGGICVNLYDEAGELIESTTTDTNGYYGFNVQPAKYTVEFVLPEWLDFTTQNVGDDAERADSDADPLSGRADADVQSTLLYLDAGLIPSEQIDPHP